MTKGEIPGVGKGLTSFDSNHALLTLPAGAARCSSSFGPPPLSPWLPCLVYFLLLVIRQETMVLSTRTPHGVHYHGDYSSLHLHVLRMVVIDRMDASEYAVNSYFTAVLHR